MHAPEPLVVAWQGIPVRVRHDDRHLTPYSAQGAVIRSCVELATDVEGLRLVLYSALGHRYEVRVNDDGTVIGLRRVRVAPGTGREREPLRRSASPPGPALAVPRAASLNRPDP